MRLIVRLKRLFKGKPAEGGPATNGSNQATEALRKTLLMLEQTREDEYSCDEVYQLLDQYAEAVQRGEDPAHLMPLVKYHLDLCVDCHEEYEALLRILEASPPA
jgi:hypothetical protein